jgi:hypothetical protein
VVDNIKEIMNSDLQVITDNARLRPEKSEVFRLWCDNTKIYALTVFVPKYTFQKGLKKTIDWFTNLDNLRKYKIDIYNV